MKKSMNILLVPFTTEFHYYEDTFKKLHIEDLNDMGELPCYAIPCSTGDEVDFRMHAITVGAMNVKTGEIVEFCISAMVEVD